jgi:hypothetical protein
MRIITQKIDAITDVCPRLGLIMIDGPFVGGKLMRGVFPNSPCARANIVPHDVILHVNQVPLDRLHRLEFSDRRRTELDVEVWRDFQNYRKNVRIEPEPFASIEEVLEQSAAFVSSVPLKPITFRNPSFAHLPHVLKRFYERQYTWTGGVRKGRQ